MSAILELVGNTSKIDHGSGTSLDDIGQGTIGALFNFEDLPGFTGHNQIVLHKGTRFWWGRDAAGDNRLRLERPRATTPLVIEADFNDFTPQLGGGGIWVWATFDIAGPDSAQKFFSTDHSSLLPVEPSLYATQQTGSGALTTDVGSALIVGNVPGNGEEMEGTIGNLVIFKDRILTTREMMLVMTLPRSYQDCSLLTSYGLAGTGTQTDFSGNAHHGTTTAVTLRRGYDLARPMFGFEYGEDEAPILFEEIDNDQLARMGFAASAGGTLSWMW